MVGLRRKTEIDGIYILGLVSVLDGFDLDCKIRTAEFAHPATNADFRSFRKDLAVFQHENLLGTERYTDATALAILLTDYVEITLFLFSHILLYY
jgi:hypothetical protein